MNGKPLKLVSVDQMRVLERRSDELGVSYASLMETAGVAVARSVRRFLGGAAGQRILVLVGPGNNGGDGLVAARQLHDWGAVVTAVLLAPRPSDDATFNAVAERRIEWVTPDAPGFEAMLQARLAGADAVLDAVLGTGRSRPLAGAIREVLAAVGAARAHTRLKVVAVDVPTGVDADSGAADPAVLRADLTVTLGFPKTGLFRHPGAAMVGALEIADIGLPNGLGDGITAELLTAGGVRALLPERPSQANKGTFGRALVVAGCGNYPGAAALACHGALRSGAGLVTLAATPAVGRAAAAALPEPTHLPLQPAGQDAIAGTAVETLVPAMLQYDALLLGCGLGQHPETRLFVERLLLGDLTLPPRLLIDADALNFLASLPQWWERLPQGAVLTPHPGEMARLLGSTVAEVQADRIGAGLAAAAQWRLVVVLKGAHTIIAAPDGRWRLSPFANPVLASAGTGDVLAGIIAGLMAQGASPFDGASVGVYLHGAAGEAFARAHGDAGLLASDLCALLPDVMRAVKAGGPVEHRRI
ncbi:MAG: NAD(P)H-hydrate dehydratase [Dehalococcoidia bacterium]|nr:NAD(P)H-hydrate dehydratase [Dehalococcoidia bacterium]